VNRATGRRRLLGAIISTLVAMVLAMAGIEVWTRATWNPKRGKPGFYLSDPIRHQRLAPNYRGWFGGVPVRINSLGFRDSRDYSLEKPSGTFRILLLGDSVTFGHGSIYEHTYPVLFEQMLKAWRPEMNWQVWNAAVPGYNTGDELAALYDVGPRFRPDLVVICFYPNDMFDNHPVTAPSAVARWRSALLEFMQRHLYSTEFYKKALLQLAWRLTGSSTQKARLEALAGEEPLLNHLDSIVDLTQQQLTPVRRFTDDELKTLTCPSRKRSPVEAVEAELRNAPGYDMWIRAVRELQALNRRGDYRIVFFVNPHLERCQDGDYFDPAEPAIEDEIYRRILSDGAPAYSAFDEFRHYRPSQMPIAGGHSLGNSNAVKARALFNFLSQSVFPAIPALRAAARLAPAASPRR
jgi:hypothetical protein